MEVRNNLTKSENNLLTQPQEILLHILSFLSVKDLISLSEVSILLEKLTKNLTIWKHFIKKNTFDHIKTDHFNSSTYTKKWSDNPRRFFATLQSQATLPARCYYLIIKGGTNNFINILNDLYDLNDLNSYKDLTILSIDFSTERAFNTFSNLSKDCSFIVELDLTYYQAKEIQKFIKEPEEDSNLDVISAAFKQTKAIHMEFSGEKIKKEIAFSNNKFIIIDKKITEDKLTVKGKQYVNLGERRNFHKK